MEEILKSYYQLARKLGKLPTSREIRKFICSGDKVTRLFGSFNKLKDAAIKEYPDLDGLIIPFVLSDEDIENYRLGIEKTKRQSKNKASIRESSARDFIKHFSDSVFKGRVTPAKPPKLKKALTRSLILTLSDLHFGSDVNEAETGHLNYGRLEESRRFAEIVKQTIEYKPQYRATTDLHINLLGDIIQQKLHDPQDAAPVSEQVCRAIHLLTQGIAQLAENFGKVTVHCATGNHGRDLNRHKGRATSGKWDSIETIIYYAVKSSLSRYTNLTIDIPKTPYCIYEVFGHKVLATHGDNVINPGNIGKAINVKRLEEQINRINASLRDSDEIKLVFVGHVHVASVTKLGCGANLITNGPLCPIDQFAVSLGILEGQSSQTLVEATAEYPLGDVRFIVVGERQDKDGSLNSIITPWMSF